MKYEKDKITVIIPVYNVENYLERCLKSILYNTYTNLEIICVNDGSTDNSKKILESYSKRDKRVVVINKKNAGVSSARNAGIKIATGEYIAFVDSDDWIHEKYFEWFPPYVHGLYRTGRIRLFVTSGLSSEKQKLPRWNNRPEIAVLNVH